MKRNLIVIRQSLISRDDLRNNPTVCYVFGDNQLREGYGGQAYSMRGEPNSIGIITKKIPRLTKESYFYDEDIDLFKKLVDNDLNTVVEYASRSSGIIVFPSEGVGTGYASLFKTSKKCYDYLQKAIFKKLGVNNIV